MSPFSFSKIEYFIFAINDWQSLPSHTHTHTFGVQSFINPIPIHLQYYLLLNAFSIVVDATHIGTWKYYQNVCECVCVMGEKEVCNGCMDVLLLIQPPHLSWNGINIVIVEIIVGDIIDLRCKRHRWKLKLSVTFTEILCPSVTCVMICDCYRNSECNQVPNDVQTQSKVRHFFRKDSFQFIRGEGDEEYAFFYFGKI